MICIVASADSSVGRVNKDLLSTQTCMELFVEGLTGNVVFQNAEGEFDDIKNWDGLKLNTDSDVEGIHFEDRAVMEIFGSQYDESIGMETGGSIDFNWVPRSVKILSLLWLEISGTIQTTELPRGLERFEINGNSFDGTLNTEGLPRGLHRLDAGSNRLSGSLDLTKLPEALQLLQGSTNEFTGILDFSLLPRGLQSLHLSNNSFSGTIDMRDLPKSLQKFEIHTNSIEQTELVIDNNLPNLEVLILDAHKFHKIIDQSGEAMKTIHIRNAQTMQVVVNG